MREPANTRRAATEAVLLHGIQDLGTIARFWSRVQKGPECWIWIGGKSGEYGQFMNQGCRILAHRFSWQLAHEQLAPAGQVVRHRCDKPSCVRPDHLEAGSIAQNVRDIYERSRRSGGTWPRGADRPNALLDDEAVAQLRRAARGGRSIRSLAVDAGVSYSTAYRAIRGTGWPHVSEPPIPSGSKRKPHWNNFVRNNPKTAAKARELRDQGLALQQVADQLGITKTAAFHCCQTQPKGPLS